MEEMTRLCLWTGGGGNEVRPATKVNAGAAATREGKQQQGSAGGARKKYLPLNVEQAPLLEASFHAHGGNLPAHGVKRDLARRLRLEIQQVEAWFQDRRARFKLEQAELERDLLRQWCDRLAAENAWLRREITGARGCLACWPEVAPSMAAATMVRDAAAVGPSSGGTKFVIDLD